MAEEFQESEVMFEEGGDEIGEDSGREGCSCKKKMLAATGAEKTNFSNWCSPPMKIPAPRNAWQRYVAVELDGDDGEMVPPHVIIGRRVAGKMMAFSICSGKGMTLKGRDLSQVRNSILRMTGFLET